MTKAYRPLSWPRLLLKRSPMLDGDAWTMPQPQEPPLQQAQEQPQAQPLAQRRPQQRQQQQEPPHVAQSMGYLSEPDGLLLPLLLPLLLLRLPVGWPVVP